MIAGEAQFIDINMHIECNSSENKDTGIDY